MTNLLFAIFASVNNMMKHYNNLSRYDYFFRCVLLCEPLAQSVAFCVGPVCVYACKVINCVAIYYVSYACTY